MRIALVGVVALVACKGGARESPAPQPQPRRAEPAGARAFYASTFAKRPSVAEMTALGALAFRDRSLSGSGQLACASCHDPDRAFGPANAAAVQLGGARGDAAGVRAAPSLRYLQAVPRFTEHFHDGDDGVDQGPTGGLTWDGRAQTTHDQAKLPLFSPLEMANGSPDALAARLARAPYADRLRAAFGDDVLAHTDSAVKALALVLEVYQQDPAQFYPYSSKYDAVLRGRAKLSEREARGFAIFNDPARGNCASCHPSTVSGTGFPAFTDYGFVALGVPRNRAIPANRDAGYYDLGLCGPYRTDFTARHDYCGMFRTPSLRNVTLRRRFMHNGVFGSLHEVLEFYATRDREPARWYPRGIAFDDLPASVRDNVTREAPFRGTRRLSETDLADLEAFLATLTDE